MSTPEPTSLDTDIRVGLMLSLGGDYTQEQENDAVNRVQTLISQEVSKGIREFAEKIKLSKRSERSREYQIWPDVTNGYNEAVGEVNEAIDQALTELEPLKGEQE